MNLARRTLSVVSAAEKGSMAGKLLDISERSAGLMDEPGCSSDESPPARMRRASLEPNRFIEIVEPVHDRFGGHGLARSLRRDDRPVSAFLACSKPRQTSTQISMEGNASARSTFGR